MNGSIPPRLRAPAVLAIAALVALAIGGASHGWGSVAYVAPIPLAIVIGFYLWSGRDSDTGAAIRGQLDERQAYRRLRVQALVGRILSVAVAVGYIAASAGKAVLWPWAVLLGVLAVSFLIGWLVYGEHGSGQQHGVSDD
jgi:hypothetical protein